MSRYAVRVHPLEDVPEIFYYLDTVFVVDNEDELFEAIAFKREFSGLEPYWDEIMGKQAAVIPLSRIPYAININD